MKFELIEEPQKTTSARPPVITQAERLEAAAQADFCVKWLQAQGFEVLYVHKGPRNPRVNIRTSPLCEQLEGAVRMYERLHGKPAKRYWVAIRFGCEVRWTEMESAVAA